MDLALNNLQRLICHKTQSINQSTISIHFIYIYIYIYIKGYWIIYKKCKGSYRFRKSQEKILYIMYMDIKVYIKIFAKN